MMIEFEMKGKIKAKDINDAINSLELMKMDYDLDSIRLNVYDPKYDMEIVVNEVKKSCKEK